ncbi:hypothetical protein CHARACLAT_001761, partial [Characodon lateralis]|nr:hypothetical protein [Characodon lateralis]
GSWCLDRSPVHRRAIQTHTQDKQLCTHSFMPKGNLERPNNLTVMFLDCGRKPEYLGRPHGETMQKDPQLGVKPRTFLLQGNSPTNCSTVQPSPNINSQNSCGDMQKAGQHLL